MQILLNLLAGVALLVWGTHLVRTDILRLYGGDLRRVLRQSVGNRFAAFGAGLTVTALLQSSTATALIVSSFVGQGLIATYRTRGPAVGLSKGLDRDRAVDESGNQVAVFGRRGARPFNAEEQRRLYMRGDTVYTVPELRRDADVADRFAAPRPR